MKGKKPYIGGPVLYCSFRKTIQGVLIIGEVNYSIRKPKGNRLLADFYRGARCARLESMVRIPEAGRSMPEQDEASRRGGGGPNQY